MAFLAVTAQLAAVFVNVAARALRGKPKVGTGEVLHLDALFRRRSDAGGCVALNAFEPGVTAQQRIPGLLMLEFLSRRVPLDDVEFVSVVVGMAADALLLRPVFRLHDTSVKSRLGLNTRTDLAMAAHAFEARRSDGQRVTRRAFRGAFEGTVRVR